MKIIMDKAKIKAFVQNTLGCGCPEEVFQHIECASPVRLNDISILYRINIGNRLLIFITSVDSIDSIGRILPILISAGISDRDRSGFNRFRLVLAIEDGKAAGEIAQDLFARIQKDEKVHLHILPKTSIPTF